MDDYALCLNCDKKVYYDAVLGYDYAEAHIDGRTAALCEPCYIRGYRLILDATDAKETR